jgi:hypothetical protein
MNASEYMLAIMKKDYPVLVTTLQGIRITLIL